MAMGLFNAPSPQAQTVTERNTQALADKAAVLTIDSEALFNNSLFGQRVLQELTAEEAVLMAENRRIQAELTKEERELTARRETMDAKAFRAIADAFDARVVQIRSEQDQKSANIERRRQQEQEAFIRVASPVLTDLMKETGAQVILERRTVLLADPAVDITATAIKRLDLRLGDGNSPTDEENAD